MFIGTPIIPDFIYKNGVEATLDSMREMAGINTVLVFSNNMVQRQYSGKTKRVDPESGRAYTDVFVRVDERHYRHTPLRQLRDANDIYADRDVVDDLCVAAEPRGMKVYARILEPYVITGAIPGLEACAEIDCLGNPTEYVCFNHPDYIGWWHGVIEDLIANHPQLTGFKFGQERGGPIGQAMQGGASTCFCPHCQAKARERGLRVAEARAGMNALREFAVDASRERPNDGYYVSFLRTLTRHPELMHWQRLWMDSREEQRRRIYQQIKSMRPDMQVGWHIDHGMCWDPFTRAYWDYADMTPHSDWLSLALYFDCLGARSLGHFNRNYRKGIFGDAKPELAHAMYMSVLGMDPEREPKLAEHEARHCAMSAESVAAEVRRAARATAGSRTQLYARVGFDVPMYKADVQPEQVRAATFAALDAGAHGLFLGREWGELSEPNIRAFGDALRERGLIDRKK